MFPFVEKKEKKDFWSGSNHGMDNRPSPADGQTRIATKRTQQLSSFKWHALHAYALKLSQNCSLGWIKRGLCVNVEPTVQFLVVKGIWSWRGVCLVWWGGHSKHLEICVAMSTGKKEGEERGMIDENERNKRKRGKGLAWMAEKSVGHYTAMVCFKVLGLLLDCPVYCPVLLYSRAGSQNRSNNVIAIFL